MRVAVHVSVWNRYHDVCPEGSIDLALPRRGLRDRGVGVCHVDVRGVVCGGSRLCLVLLTGTSMHGARANGHHVDGAVARK